MTKLTKGDFVKIVDKGERFWTIIKKIDGNKIKAKIDNKLIFKHKYNYGDIIEFLLSDIVEIKKKIKKRKRK